MTPKELLDQKAREAVLEEYRCSDFGEGKYKEPRPCSCLADCRFGQGTRENYDLRDDCMADEYEDGFKAGWLAAIRYLMNEIPHNELIGKLLEFNEFAKKEKE